MQFSNNLLLPKTCKHLSSKRALGKEIAFHSLAHLRVCQSGINLSLSLLLRTCSLIGSASRDIVVPITITKLRLLFRRRHNRKCQLSQNIGIKVATLKLTAHLQREQWKEIKVAPVRHGSVNVFPAT